MMKTTLFAVLAGLTLASAAPAMADPAPAPAAGNLPTCSATVTDHCMQRPATSRAMPHRHRHQATHASKHRARTMAHRGESKLHRKHKS